MEYGLRVKKLSTRASHSESEVESDCESVSSAVSVVHCTVRNQQNEFYQRDDGSYVPYHENCALSYSDNAANAGTCYRCCKPSYTMPADGPTKRKIR